MIVSTSAVSFWQADQNWSIQQRIWKLSCNSSAEHVPGPSTPANTSGVASADQIALARATEPLRSAAISALAYFAAQNSRAKALGQNRRSYEKLQGRTNLPLT
jgi:hypothetical protein